MLTHHIQARRFPRIWLCAMAVIGVNEREAKGLWKRLLSSQDPTVKAFCFSVAVFKDRIKKDQSDIARLFGLFDETICPKELVEALEILVEERRLPRDTATQIEERILNKTSRKGLWR